jgi:hypothetical protein
MGHCQVKAMAEHNRMAQKKATQLLAILQGQAIEVSEMRYKDITEVLKGCYRVHPLFTA